MKDISEEEPTDVPGLGRWITSQIAAWQNRADEPIGDSGTIYFPIADGTSCGKLAKATMHASSPAYFCAAKFRNLVIKLCSSTVAFELSQRFPDRADLKVRDMILAMRWLAELMASPETSSRAGKQSEAEFSKTPWDSEDSICDGLGCVPSNGRRRH